VYELLTMTEPLRELVMRRASSAAIAAAAASDGALASLKADAFAKVRLGETSLTEALRVVPA
jgi:type II secretory ATPase GspE/PulE/Tfp pilus assembly ATPase PilB-like protein